MHLLRFWWCGGGGDCGRSSRRLRDHCVISPRAFDRTYLGSDLLRERCMQLTEQSCDKFRFGVFDCFQRFHHDGQAPLVHSGAHFSDIVECTQLLGDQSFQIAPLSASFCDDTFSNNGSSNARVTFSRISSILRNVTCSPFTASIIIFFSNNVCTESSRDACLCVFGSSSASSGGGVLGCVNECRNLVCTFPWDPPHASTSCSLLLSTW